MIDSGDTAWVMVSTALVLLMTPGLALFYGGLVQRKNVLNITMQSYIAMIILSLEWVLVGYSLAFGPDRMGLIGDLSWMGLSGIGLDPNPDYAASIPALIFMGFQMMFAIITPALITGSVAERMRFGAYVLFIFLIVK
jgi:Amt family ammonium transporter